MNLYEALGIDKTAGAAEIKTAYRRLAQQHHPDKGGDKQRFQQIQEAYAVLSDDEKRAEYDTTGRMPGTGPTMRDQAMALIAELMDMTLQQVNPDFDNPLRHMEAGLHNTREALDAQIVQLQRKETVLQNAAKRTSAKKGNQDSLGMVMQHLLEKVRQPLAVMKAKLEVCEVAREILAEHDYQADQRPAQPQGLFAQQQQAAEQNFFNLVFRGGV